MKCFLRDYGFQEPKEVELEHALNPEPDNYDSGAMESASRTASAACAALGKLSALLVEKGFISIEEAAEAMGVYPRPYFTESKDEEDDD